MLDTIHDPLTTYSGTPLPAWPTVSHIETVHEGEENVAQGDVTAAPTPENLDRFIAAATRHMAALKQAILVATVMRRTAR